MGAADKVALMYTLNRAYFPTLTAGYTFFVIYSGEVIYYLYCLGGTALFTLTASYTAVLTELAHLCALVMIIALNHDSGYVVYKVNYSVGAGLFTKTATDTFLGIYFCYAAFRDRNRIAGTNLSAVAVTKTSKGTEAVSRKVEICRLAGRRAAINILSFFGEATAVTSNVSHLLNDFSRFKSKYFRYFLGSSVSAGGTKIGFVCYSLAKSLCIAIASGKSTSAAICARKALANKICSFILFNTEEFCRNGEKHRAKNTRAEKEENWN